MCAHPVPPVSCSSHRRGVAGEPIEMMRVDQVACIGAYCARTPTVALTWRQCRRALTRVLRTKRTSAWAVAASRVSCLPLVGRFVRSFESMMLLCFLFTEQPRADHLRTARFDVCGARLCHMYLVMSVPIVLKAQYIARRCSYCSQSLPLPSIILVHASARCACIVHARATLLSQPVVKCTGDGPLARAQTDRALVKPRNTLFQFQAPRRMRNYLRVL